MALIDAIPTNAEQSAVFQNSSAGKALKWAVAAPLTFVSPFLGSLYIIHRLLHGNERFEVQRYLDQEIVKGDVDNSLPTRMTAYGVGGTVGLYGMHLSHQPEGINSLTDIFVPGYF